MKDEVQSLLDRARVNLDAAETLLQNRFAAIAASRVYYAMFYAACAILRKQGLEFTRHAAVHGSFGRLFAKTGKIDPKYHRHLIDAFAFRQTADYGASGEADVSADDAKDALQRGREFVTMAEGFLSRGAS